MNAQSRGLRVASAIFALFTVGHIVRLIQHAQLMVGHYSIPLWASVVAAVIAALLSFWLWKLSSTVSK